LSRHISPDSGSFWPPRSARGSTAMAFPRDGEPPSTSEDPTCAVCLERVFPTSKALMPCCDRVGASVEMCAPCVRFICARGLNGVGRCPKCRAHVRPVVPVVPGGRTNSAARTSTTSTATNTNQFELAVMRGTCMLCRQQKDLLDERSVCDACVYGARFALRHECHGCGKTQRIPHPMWRYQTSVESFGNVAWACHGRCRAFTKWRVLAEDVPRVPPEDAPQSWGTTEAWLAQIRHARREEERARDVEEGGDHSGRLAALARWVVSLFSAHRPTDRPG
jgi:hypothetical protein